MLKKLRNVLSNEEGQDIAEYAVMLALIVVVCLTAIKTVGTNAKTTRSHATNAAPGVSAWTVSAASQTAES